MGDAVVIDWDALDWIEVRNQEWRSKLGTGLSETYVPGEGDNPTAFIIGEAPGADEDVKRRPFVGPSGVVLRQLMALAGLWTQPQDIGPAELPYDVPVNANCWLTNVVKFRPPRNRNPTDQEIAAARPWLMQEWHAVGAPRVIITVGSIALRAVTSKRASILRAAGKCHYCTAKSGQELAIWPMVHPSYAMRLQNAQLNQLLEDDWERLGVWRNNAPNQ